MLKSDMSVVSTLVCNLIENAERVLRVDMVPIASNTNVAVQSACNQCYATTQSITDSFVETIINDAQRLLFIDKTFQYVDQTWKKKMENSIE